jgi:putative copper export protein
MRGARAGGEAALEALSLLAIAIWLGGLTTLGAVVAPLVFGIVPAPFGADAMTAVFRRYDSVAIACAAVVLVVEAAHARLRTPLLRRDLVRAGLGVVAATLAIVEATTISPHIERLHREGAIRGLGAAGIELDSVHHVAESLAKSELMLLAAVLVLHAIGRGRAGEPVRSPGD